MWFDVDKNAGSISGRNHNYMGRICRKSFFPLLGRRESENGPENVCIGHDYTHLGEQEHQHSQDQEELL